MARFLINTRVLMQAQQDLVIRALEPRDAMDIWRLYRARTAPMSPFFFMVVARHCADVGVVAERDGDLVGFLLANPRAGDFRGRILAMCVSSDEGNATASAMLEGLLQRPAFRHVRELEAASTQVPLAVGLLGAIGKAHEPSLAKGTPARACDLPRARA